MLFHFWYDFQLCQTPLIEMQVNAKKRFRNWSWWTVYVMAELRKSTDIDHPGHPGPPVFSHHFHFELPISATVRQLVNIRETERRTNCQHEKQLFSISNVFHFFWKLTSASDKKVLAHHKPEANNYLVLLFTISAFICSAECPKCCTQNSISVANVNKTIHWVPSIVVDCVDMTQMTMAMTTTKTSTAQ